ncbi:MAG TPA: DUF3536 domain-containing protein [Candidatus Krumholzibacteriaceae bacterium]|nr:DUF3536 domain-containing protein [Candidatus Krumholzibacteriaceae bacterium]
MKEKADKKHLIIHGHFYQPPRENPWTQRIDRQESAAPYHDWNEKITHECYFPNSSSRCLDGFGRIKTLVTNYTRLSFNFGPTLLRWIEQHHRGLHKEIIRADRAGAELNKGHGNAIAQGYNHIIMPLASKRDQETQISWGVAEFKRCFGREPEGIWLSETAVNQETLYILIDRGFRFIILSPQQAESFRPLKGKGKWKDVTDGTIPTGFVYRCRGGRPRAGDNYIDIFFYDEKLSQDISFNHLLRDGDLFAESIASSYRRCGNDLVTIATDGEIYGHHEPFADMALAHLFESAAEKHNLTITNFGAYLDTHQPEFEVKLKSGENNLGTAWSCSHGVGRWKEDCGCNVNAPEGWNQKWRKPLRDSLNILRDRLAKIFDTEGGRLLEDPWKARDDYISVMNSGGSENVNSFLSEHSIKPLSREEKIMILNLLESQRNAMLMFTSCGWFFNDISGLESVQIIKYAARAIELAGEKYSGGLEEEFLAELQKAESNLKDAGTGAEIYRSARKFSSITPSFIAGQYALSSHLSCPEASPAIFGWSFNKLDSYSKESNGGMIYSGLLEIEPPVIPESYTFGYLLLMEEEIQVICLIREFKDREEFEKIKEDISSLPSGIKRKDVLSFAVEHFGGMVFSIRDLFPEDRDTILASITDKKLESLESLLEDIYLKNREFLRLLSESSLTPPESILVPARVYLEKKLSYQLRNWQKSLRPEGIKGIRKIISDASYYGIDIDKSSVSDLFSGFLLENIKRQKKKLIAEESEAMIQFVNFCEEIDVEIKIGMIQNHIFTILNSTFKEEAEKLPPQSKRSGNQLKPPLQFLKLAERFNFNISAWKELL